MSHFFEQNFISQTFTIHGSHLFMSYFLSKMSINIIVVKPYPTTLPPASPPHPKKCDTKKCDPSSNLHNEMGHTYSCRTFLRKISTSQTCTMNGSHLFMSHFLSKISNNIIAVIP